MNTNAEYKFEYEQDGGVISSALSDYLEAIYLLSREKNVVRITDIAKFLNISKPSVNRAVNTLKLGGYVQHEPYGDIALTPMGKRYGHDAFERHTVIKRFLMKILSMDEDFADAEAAKLEHCVSSATLLKMQELL